MKLKWPFISQKRDRKMTDEMEFHIVLTLLGAVAGLASYVPARRAARVERLTALDRSSRIPCLTAKTRRRRGKRDARD